MVNGDAERDYKARLSHLKIWSDYNGYGFNMHCIKGKDGEYIGKVESGSPAEFAGLIEGDHVIEVNGENVEKENHMNVVQKIKNNPNETKLLLVDPEAENYFHRMDIPVSSNMSQLDIRMCPDQKPGGKYVY